MGNIDVVVAAGGLSRDAVLNAVYRKAERLGRRQVGTAERPEVQQHKTPAQRRERLWGGGVEPVATGDQLGRADPGVVTARRPEPTGLLSRLAADVTRGHGEQFLLHGGRRVADSKVELAVLATLTELAAQRAGGAHFGPLPVDS